jgi:hypothetical protein
VGLGCSYGCDFCSPSHFFGRRHIKFYTRGRDLFEEMLRVEQRFRSNRICFIGDDNFLIDLKRAEELRRCVVESGRVYDILIFGTADQAVEFGPERLAEMGVGTIWIGREGKFSDYRKNKNVNMAGLVAELRHYGIKTILSSILLLDQHTRDNIGEDIGDHLACRPAFSQFAFYSPLPGTPLYERMSRENRILTAIPYEEWHAFKQPWFVHPEFNLDEAERVQERAYQRDFEELGPSILRVGPVSGRPLPRVPRPSLGRRSPAPDPDCALQWIVEDAQDSSHQVFSARGIAECVYLPAGRHVPGFHAEA